MFKSDTRVLPTGRSFQGKLVPGENNNVISFFVAYHIEERNLATDSRVWGAVVLTLGWEVGGIIALFVPWRYFGNKRILIIQKVRTQNQVIKKCLEVTQDCPAPT